MSKLLACLTIQNGLRVCQKYTRDGPGLKKFRFIRCSRNPDSFFIASGEILEKRKSPIFLPAKIYVKVGFG